MAPRPLVIFQNSPVAVRLHGGLVRSRGRIERRGGHAIAPTQWAMTHRTVAGKQRRPRRAGCGRKRIAPPTHRRWRPPRFIRPGGGHGHGPEAKENQQRASHSLPLTRSSVHRCREPSHHRLAGIVAPTLEADAARGIG